MSSNTTIKATINIGAKINDFQSALNTIQSGLGKLHLDPALKGEFTSLFTNMTKEIENLQNKTKNNELKLVDEKSARESLSKVSELYQDLINKLKDKNLSIGGLEANVASINKMKDLVEKYNTELGKSSDKLKDAQKAYDDQLKVIENIKKAQEQAQRSVIKSDIAVKGAEEQLKITQAIGAEERKRAEDLRAELESRRNNLEVQKQLIQESQKTNTGSTRGWNATFNSLYANEIKEVAQLEKDLAAAEELAKQKTEEGAAARERAQAAVDKLRDRLETQKAALNAANAQYTTSIDKLKEFEQAIEKIKSDAFSKIADEVNKIDWSQFGVDKVPTDFQTLSEAIAKVEQHSAQAAAQIRAQLDPALKQAAASSKSMKDGFDATTDSINKMKSTQSDLDRLTGRLVRFFSIDNAVRLFRRAIRSAMETVKELDKAMTETAVVTKFTVNDMWKTLPEYTKRANELGLAVKSVYEASTLYYQQGLKTNEVMQLTNATLRMARIASLDASDATDRMTNALRGFNMELNEVNADNVADVYSKLAAISASNVDEISTAMTKVASLAHSANMEFENTAAFLAQIIETTRESAETAGTALKTVVARFSEVKDAVDKGHLEGDIINVDGEDINVNKVAEALRIAGINLNEFLVGQRGLDSIFMELASKWDSLDIVQQRYIATMAAGSRQQSRFIALMSDYKRTVELTTAANNASGASMEQYNKTLESIETKTARLKNAWNEFLMGIANNEFIGKAIDLLTNLLNAINKITDGISGGNGMIKAFANIAVAVGGLKLGGTIIKALLGDPTAGVKGYISQLILGIKGQGSALTAAGVTAGKKFSLGFSTSLGKAGLANAFKKTLTASDLGIKELDMSTVNFTSFTPASINTQSFKNALAASIDRADFSILSPQQAKEMEDLSAGLKAGTKNAGEAQVALQRTGLQVKMTGEEAERAGLQFQNSAAAMNIMRVGCMAVGGALVGLASLIEKSIGKSNEWTKALKNTGIALLGIGAIFPILNMAIQSFATKASISISSIPILGWIAGIIAALTFLITLLIEANHKIDRAMEEASKAIEENTERFNTATESVNNLNSALDDLGEKVKKIEELRKGTTEWNQAVKENNQLVLDLMAKYEGLDIESENGILKINNLQDKIDEYQARANAAQLNTIGAQLYLKQLQREKANTNLSSVRMTVRDYNGYADSGMMKHLIDWASQRDTFTKDDLRREFIDFQNKAYERRGVEQVEEDAFTVDWDQLNESVITAKESQREYTEAIESSIKAINAFAASLPENSKYLKSDFADSFLNNTHLGESWRNIYNSTLYNAGRLDKVDDEEVKKLYQQWVKDTYGLAAYTNMDSGTGNFKVDGQTIAFNNEEVQKEFAAWAAGQKMGSMMGTYVKSLERLQQSGGNTGVIQALSALEGKNLTIAGIQALFGKEIDIAELTQKDSFDKGSDAYNTLVNLFSKDLDLQQAYGGMDFVNEFIADVKDAVIPAADAFDKLMDDELGRAIVNYNFTSDISTKIYDQFAKAFTGKDFEEYKNLLPDFSKLGIKNEADQLKFIEKFSNLDFKNKDDLMSFEDSLDELDITFSRSNLKEYLEDLANGTNALVSVDVKKFTENSKDLLKITKDLRSGKQDRVFSEDTYNKLLDLGIISASDFQLDEDGNFVYLGDKLDDILKAITDYTSKTTEEGKKQLEYQVQAGDILKNAQKNGAEIEKAVDEAYNNLDVDYNTGLAHDKAKYTITSLGRMNFKNLAGQINKEDIKDFVDFDENQRLLYNIIQEANKLNIDLKKSPIEGLDNFTAKEIADLDPEDVTRFVTEYMNYAEHALDAADQLITMENQEAIKELLTKNNEELVNSFDENAENIRAALLVRAQSIIPKDIYDSFLANKNWTQDTAFQISQLMSAYTEGKELSFDTEQLTTWTDQLMKANTALAQYQGVAAQVALANTKLNKGVSDLISNWEKVEDLFSENGPLGKNTGRPLQFTSSEQNEAYQTMKKNLEIALDLDQALSDSFFDNSKNIELLNDLINGTAEAKEQALEGLRTAAALDVVLNDESITTDVQNDLVNLISTLDIPDLEVGAQLNNEPFINSLQSMLEAGDLTVEQLKAILDGMGLAAEIDYSKKVYVPAPDPDADVDWGTGLQGKFKEVPLTVPQIRYVFSKGNGVGKSGLSPSNLSNTGKKSSGSSKESKNKTWKNPYDELYNLQEDINAALREREKLEHKYQDMLENHKTLSGDLIKNSLAEVASLKRQLSLQNEMLAGRKRQMANVASEKYEDSEGNLKTYAQMGATKYAYYNENTQEVVIDWKALEAASGNISEDQGKAIEAYISRLEEIRDKIQDTEDAIEDAKDQIFEIQNRNKEEYLNFEQQIYDALLNKQQKFIDGLENVSSAISEATNKTIQSIQDQIEAERQARENEKAQQDLYDKEMRLAYLQRDTSGANALEIQKLQEEINNDQQSYQDRIIDQTIQEMQDEAARAEEQRQAQIDLLNAQFEYDKQHGTYWEVVEQLLSDAFNEDGSINENSNLYKLLDEDHEALSKIGELNWQQELARQIAAAMEGRFNWEMGIAKENKTMTLANGTVLTYDEATDSWTDKETGQKYTNFRWNPEAGGTGAFEADPVTNPGSDTTQPKAGEGADGVIGKITAKTAANVRDSIGGSKLGTIAKDGTAEVLGMPEDNNGWWKIRFNGKTAYTISKEQGYGDIYKFTKYAQGGLVDFTGPAWLDGSKAHPEMVLSAADTQNLVVLKNVLAAILSGANGKSGLNSAGNNYFDINIQADINSDYDVDRLADRIKKQIYDDASYRNVNAISYIR